MSAVELGSVADLATTTSGPDQISRRLEALPPPCMSGGW
ncbi:hypothetical protein J2R76_005651 [Bradyrhizobium sp. USDA 4532]|nr:hypothetical protein [Bradyrhizobium sp. USDA 4545]MCP1922060.1 hypothetical protein [Bradyrhizobium sp. USDA 4532]